MVNTQNSQDLWIRRELLENPGPADIHFAWCWPPEDRAKWKKIPIPDASFLEVNRFLNTVSRFDKGFDALLKAVSEVERKAGYEEGFADEALPPDGQITF